MKVLSSAAVGVLGRGDSSRRWRGVVLLLFAHVTVAAQPASLLQDLAAKIAGSISANEPVSVSGISTDSALDPAVVQTAREVAGSLTARGVRVVPPAAGVAAITVSCSRNLRERSCAAEIQRLGGTELVAVSAPPGGGAANDAAPAIALEAEPVVGQRAAILDIAMMTDRLVVLDRDALTVYRRDGNGWQRAASRPLAYSRVPPRDLRGRVRVNGTTIEAFVTGATCRGPLELTTVACTEEREPWPLAVENGGIDATRNSFQTPEGVAFVAAAALDAAADARYALVDVSGRIVLLDEKRANIGSIGVSDDIVGLTAPCRPGAYVVLSSAPSDADSVTLRPAQIVARRVVAIATPITLPGRLTALWADSESRLATAVTHNVDTGRYDAFQLRLRCDR